MVVAVVEGERLAQAVHQFGQLLAGQVGRRAAPQVQLGELATAIEQRPLHGDFTLQVRQVLGRAMGLAGDDLVAGAVVAKALAERNVNVGRQRLGARRLIAGMRRLQVIIDGEGLMELRRGGIGSIAWPRPVVLLDQGAVEIKGRHHDRSTRVGTKAPNCSPPVRTAGRLHQFPGGRRAGC
ncbi:hypothetical protein D9M71_562260 [compost metagenome]